MINPLTATSTKTIPRVRLFRMAVRSVEKLMEMAGPL
jgi:hypothetical protein